MGPKRSPIHQSCVRALPSLVVFCALSPFYSHSIFNALFLLYAVIQISEVDAVAPPTSGISQVPISTLAIIIPVVISVAEVAYIALGWKIYTEFGWKVYKFLGADRRIKTMFAHHQIFLCLVKFDLFFWVGFSVQFIWLVLNKNNAEYYLTCAALPLSLVVLVEGHLAARHESKWMMLSFMTGCAGAMVYFVYKVSQVHCCSWILQSQLLSSSSRCSVSAKRSRSLKSGKRLPRSVWHTPPKFPEP